MASLNTILERLAPAHRAALQWFKDFEGQEVEWPKPLPDGTFIVNKAKGIHKPKDIDYAVSVRQSLNSPYADHEPVIGFNGSWTYRYFQEQLDPAERDRQFTNRALLACKADGVPVGVLRQVKAKPNPRYLVLGLALVTEWNDGYFQLEGPVNYVVAPVRSPIQQLESALLSAATFNPPSFEDERRWVDASIALREGQGAFRKSVLEAYDHRCAISECSVVQVLEAAHIHRYFGVKTNVVSNGLLLRADLHTLYDRALIAVEPETYQLMISPKLQGTEYDEFEGRSIRLPSNAKDAPNPAALLEHKRWVQSCWDGDYNR